MKAATILLTVCAAMTAATAGAADLAGVQTAAPAAAASVEAHAGLRTGRFQAAPKAQDLWLEELSAAAYTPALLSAAGVSLKAGGGAVFSQMRGDLGPGLTELSGYRVGPELRVEHGLPLRARQTLRSFAGLGYAFGQFAGRGTDNWDGNESGSLFLMGAGAVTPTTKRYRTWGTQLSAGAAYELAGGLAVSAALGLGFETLDNDSAIVSRGREVEGRNHTAFLTRSLMLGGRLPL